MRTAAWLTSPVGSAGARTPMHGSSSSSSSAGPMNLPVLVHPGALGCASSSYSSSYSYINSSNNNNNKSAQSTPTSCCSGVYRPPSSEQMQWLSCMRALEEPGGTGERAQEAIQADVAACHRIRTYHKRWIPVEVLPWMEEAVVQEEVGVLLCPAPQCRSEVGRWDWRENIAVGLAAAASEEQAKAEGGGEQQGRRRVTAAASLSFIPFIGFDKTRVVVAPPPLGSVGSSSGLSMSLSLSQSRLALGNGSQLLTPQGAAATCAMSSPGTKSFLSANPIL